MSCEVFELFSASLLWDMLTQPYQQADKPPNASDHPLPLPLLLLMLCCLCWGPMQVVFKHRFMQHAVGHRSSSTASGSGCTGTLRC